MPTIIPGTGWDGNCICPQVSKQKTFWSSQKEYVPQLCCRSSCPSLSGRAWHVAGGQQMAVVIVGHTESPDALGKHHPALPHTPPLTMGASCPSGCPTHLRGTPLRLCPVLQYPPQLYTRQRPLVCKALGNLQSEPVYAIALVIFRASHLPPFFPIKIRKSVVFISSFEDL